MLGICRVDGASAPYQLTNCNGTAKSGGQAVVATPASTSGLPAVARYVLVADASSKSVSIVRFVFNPANETLSSAQTITVQNATANGGGTSGGRPVALALAPNGRILFLFAPHRLEPMDFSRANFILLGIAFVCT